MPLKIMLLSIFCLLYAISATGQEVHYMVIEKQARPFQIEHAGKGHSGIITELVRKIFADSPYTLTIHTYPFNRMISVLQRQEHQNWLTFGSPAWQGLQAKNLSESPVIKVSHTLLSLNSSGYHFSGRDDLKGDNIILLHGFDYPGLEQYITDGTVNEFRVKDYPAAFRMLERGLSDFAFVEIDLRIRYNLKALNKDPSHFRSDDFSSVISDYPIHLAMSPTIDQSLEQFINHRLDELLTDGTVERLIDQFTSAGQPDHLPEDS